MTNNDKNYTGVSKLDEQMGYYPDCIVKYILQGEQPPALNIILKNLETSTK